MTNKLNFEEVLERINDGFYVSRSDVLSTALNRKLWLAEWHLPGCLSESAYYCLTKSDAISAACSMAEDENGVPYGMKTALRKYGRFDCETGLYGHVINTVDRVYLAEIMG